MTWQLVEIQYMNDEVETPEDPSQYTIMLHEDGTAAVQLDCNRGTGSYDLNGSQISFGPIAATLMACAPDSLADAYAQGLNAANSFVLEDDDLYVAFGPDAGILHFTPAMKE